MPLGSGNLQKLVTAFWLVAAAAQAAPTPAPEASARRIQKNAFPPLQPPQVNVFQLYEKTGEIFPWEMEPAEQEYINKLYFDMEREARALFPSIDLPAEINHFQILDAEYVKDQDPNAFAGNKNRININDSLTQAISRFAQSKPEYGDKKYMDLYRQIVAHEFAHLLFERNPHLLETLLNSRDWKPGPDFYKERARYAFSTWAGKRKFKEEMMCDIVGAALTGNYEAAIQIFDAFEQDEKWRTGILTAAGEEQRQLTPGQLKHAVETGPDPHPSDETRRAEMVRRQQRQLYSQSKL